MYMLYINNVPMHLLIVILTIQLGSVFLCDLILQNCVYEEYKEGVDPFSIRIVNGKISIFIFVCFCSCAAICKANFPFVLRVFLLTKWIYYTYNFMYERNTTLMTNDVFMQNSSDDSANNNNIQAYFKMIILNFTQTIISILALSELVGLKFKLIGYLLNKLSISIPTEEENPQNIEEQNSYLTRIRILLGNNFFMNCFLMNLTSLDDNNRILLFLCIYAYSGFCMLVNFHLFIDFKLFHLASSNRSFKAFGPHLRTLSLSLLFICAFIFLIHRPEVNGMYSLVCILLILRTLLSLANYGLLLFDFSRIMNTKSLEDANSNTFFTDIDELLFRLKLVGLIFSYIQELIILYIWSSFILNANFSFMVL